MPQGPQFNYFDLHQCKRGEVYRIELSSALNVLLVDTSGFSAFKADRQYRYWGGLITRSPHDFVIPHDGHWYVIYHAWGLRSGGRISIRPLVEAQAMPRASPNIVSLQSIAQAAAEYPGADDAPPVAPAAKDYDVFIVLIVAKRAGIAVGGHTGLLLGLGHRLGRPDRLGVVTATDRALETRLSHAGIRLSPGCSAGRAT